MCHRLSRSGLPVFASLFAASMLVCGGTPRASAQTLKWHKKLGYCQRPAVVDVDGDDTLDLVLATRGMVYAVHGDSGEAFWRSPIGGEVLGCPAIGDIDNDARLEVVVNCSDRRVYALDLETGEQRWSFRTRAKVTASPVVVDVQGDGQLEVLVAGQDGVLYLLAGRGGKLWWRRELRRPMSETPAVADVDNNGTVEAFVCSDDGTLYAVSLKDGRLLWDSRLGIRDGRAVALAQLGDEPKWAVFASAGSMRRLDADREKRNWTFPLGESHSVAGGAVVADLNGDGALTVLFTGDDGLLYAVEALTGVEQWHVRLGTGLGGASTPALADMDGDGDFDVVIASRPGRLFCLEGATGSALWSQPLSYSTNCSPVVADINRDGKLEVAVSTEDGEFYVFQCDSSGKVAWAKAHGDTYNTGTSSRARQFGAAMIGVPR